ncbi:MAG: HlyC/CorC family transporter [Clostridia bacterium]|nr:HlyC/CorC family transporter [Clostridia bacterium]
MSGLLIVVLVILILLSGYFSATETAFSCLNRARVISWGNNGNKRARLVMKIVGDYDKFITNVLIGNNIVNILATIIATIIFAKIWADPSTSALMTTIIMTLSVLTFGEIVPKTLAKMFPEKFAMFSAPIIYTLSFIFYPLAFVFLLFQRLGKKVIKTQPENVTDEEILTVIDEAESTGGFDKENGELIRSAIEFNDVTVGKIITPRVDIIAVEKSMSMEEIFNVFKKTGFSRLPVYEKNIDNIIGFIHEKNFFFALHDKAQNIDNIIQPIVYTQAQEKVDDLFKLMQKKQTHICVVLDEFGGTMGIVTVEDCLEELVGEIYDETDDVENDFKKQNDDEYIVNGNGDLKDFFEKFEITLDEGEEYSSNSIGGFICEYLGLLPNKGASFIFKNLKLEILDIYRHRIKNIRVNILPKQDEE